MATSVHIAEFSELAAMPQNTDVLAYAADALITTQTVTLTTGASNSNPVNAATKFLKLTATSPVSIAISASPTAAVGGWYLASGESIVVRVPKGQSYEVSAIDDTT